jgi:hypothetical protein
MYANSNERSTSMLGSARRVARPYIPAYIPPQFINDLCFQSSLVWSCALTCVAILFFRHESPDVWLCEDTILNLLKARIYVIVELL